jgi:hypothetical protein
VVIGVIGDREGPVTIPQSITNHEPPTTLQYHRLMRSPLAVLRDATHLLAPLTAHCRTFHARWEGAAGSVAPAGCWTGAWRSEATGHHGPLRMVIQAVAPGLWQATFRAGYAGVFRACYATELHVVEADGSWRFRGSSDLGKLGGGVYEYDGEATPDTFEARYRSRHDHGVFELRRATT